MVSAPCKDCKDRFLGCHSLCEKYIEFKKKDKEEKEAIQEDKNKRYAAASFRRQQIDKALKKRGR